MRVTNTRLNFCLFLSSATLILFSGCGAPEKMANPAEQKSLELLGQTLSKAQVASYLRSAGFPEHTIGTMVCIAKYESSYNTGAINRNTNGTTDYGLFQINTYYWGSACGVSGQDLLNPAVNSRCAMRVYREQGFNAWYGYQYNRAECNAAPTPGGGGERAGYKISVAENKLFSGPTLQAAFCSRLPVGTKVTILEERNQAALVNLQSQRCVDYKGQIQTDGWIPWNMISR